MIDYIDPLVGIPVALVLWTTLGIVIARDRRRAR